MIHRALRLIPVLVMLALPNSLALAATPAAPAGSTVTITADNFVVDEGKNSATFSGHVYVVQPKVKVWADSVVALYGAGGSSDIKSFESTGHVKLVTTSQTATGDRAVFDPKTQILTLTGNVVVTTATGEVRGPSLVVDLNKNTSVFSGGKSGRVTGVFTPQ